MCLILGIVLDVLSSTRLSVLMCVLVSDLTSGVILYYTIIYYIIYYTYTYYILLYIYSSYSSDLLPSLLPLLLSSSHLSSLPFYSHLLFYFQFLPLFLSSILLLFQSSSIPPNPDLIQSIRVGSYISLFIFFPFPSSISPNF